MTSEEFLRELLDLPDIAEQKRFLTAHREQLNEEVATMLKEKATQVMRADLQEAFTVVELLRHLAKITEEQVHRALSLVAEANVRSDGGLGEYHQSVRLYNQAADIYHLLNRPVDRAKVQIGKLWSLACLGLYQEAIETGQWTSQIFEQHQEWSNLARLNSNLGLIHFRQGEDLNALMMFNRVRDFYMSLEGGDLLTSLARIEQNRSLVLRNLSQFDESIQASQAAIEMHNRSGQNARAARAQQNLGTTYFVLGRYNEALELLDKAKDFFFHSGRYRDAVLAELLTSDCLLHLRRFSEVLEKCKRVRDIFTQLGTHLEVAQAILNEAVAYSGLYRYQEALLSLGEARKLFEQEGNEVRVATTDLKVASVLYHQGAYEESLELSQTCVEVFKQRNLILEEAQAYLNAAQALTALGNYKQASGWVHKTLNIGEQNNISSLIYQARYLLGTLAKKQNDLYTSLREYEYAIYELERLRGHLMIEFRADFVADKQLLYEDMVDLCIDLKQPLQGLTYAERAKSRALQELLSFRLDLGIQAKAKEDEPLVKEMTQLRAERDNLYRRWESQEKFAVRGRSISGESNHQTIQQDVLDKEKRITELWHKLLIRNAGYANDASLWQIRTEPIQPYLASDTLLLEYFIIHGKLVIFAITSDEIQSLRIPADLQTIQRLMRLFRLNLNAVLDSNLEKIAKLSKNAQGLLQRLYKLLFSPIEQIITNYSKLIIVPHGPLHYLPFHALYDGNRFLIEQHELSYLPGASLLRFCKEVQPNTFQFSAFGHSYNGMLPHTVDEAQAITQIMGGHILVEKDATPERLRQMATESRILHLAVHGDFRPDNPLFSGLALSDGWLTTIDIFNLRLQTSLVTLSACRTGLNVVGGGDELLGLMRAFLYAGSASLLLSLWAVEDQSTSLLMQTFYTKLSQGWTKGAALRYAQMQFIHNQSRESSELVQAYTHPYFWAPFFLVGDAGMI